VLLHGVGGNHASWFQQIPVFAQSYRVIVPDQRGFGRSTDPNGEGRSAFVDDLEALLDLLGVERCAIVAQSLGGGTALGFAVRRPQRVAALVLADTLHGFAETPETAPVLAQARAASEQLTQIERVLGPTVRRNDPVKTGLYSRIASFNTVDRHTLTGAFTLAPPAALQATGIPTLFIVGQQDPIFPPAAVQALRVRLPQSFFVEVADAGHSVYFERPEEFNDSVLSFLQAVRFRGHAPAAHSNAAGYTPVK